MLAPFATARMSHRKAPSNAFQIAAPLRPIGWTGFWNMGLPPRRRKNTSCHTGCPGATRDRPDSRFGYPTQG